MSRPTSSPDSPEGGTSLNGKAMPSFACPPNFQQVEVSVEDRPLCLEDTEATELWLIKTPHNFDAKRLSGMSVSLSGRQFLNKTEECNGSYELLPSQDVPSDKKRLPHLLLPSKHGENLVPAPPFNGQLSIMETVTIPPVLLPPSPPLRSNKLPPGLQQRFLPFGWGEPKKMESADTVDGGISHSKRKKKKSRKDKKFEGLGTVFDSSESAGHPARLGDTWADTQGENEWLVGAEMKEHRKSKKRKRHDAQDDAASQSPANAEEETKQKKKTKKHKH